MIGPSRPTGRSLFQSSPAPRCGRYQPQAADFRHRMRFNPRPHRGAGATPHNSGKAWVNTVSILARTEVRALRKGIEACFAAFVFQSSPAPRCGRYNGSRRAVGFSKWFQSSPAPRCGRYVIGSETAQRTRCFNPRPHRGAGATVEGQILGRFRDGFNPRPHRGAGATYRQELPEVNLLCFNPRPHRGAGATSPPKFIMQFDRCFNPRPHRGAGATVRSQRYDYQR